MDKETTTDVEQAVYTKTTAQLDLERRLADEKLSPKELREKYDGGARDYTGDGNDTSAYVGVNPEYMNYANETDRPYQAGEGSAERELEDQLKSGHAVAEPVDGTSNQTDGGGSTVPLVYAEVSGSDFENYEVTADEAAKETARLERDAPAPAPVASTKAAPAKTASTPK
jgi:hypothetical protein